MTMPSPLAVPPRRLTPEEWQAASDFIVANLPLTDVLGTNLCLHLAGPRSRLSHLIPPGGTPYWAYAWPGGMALAAHLTAQPEVVCCRFVYDLGTGSGLVAIAALQAGAADAMGLDPDPLAAVAAHLNGRANAVPLFHLLTTESGARADIGRLGTRRAGSFAVLAGDLFYNERSAATGSAALDASCRTFGPDTPILVGDIGRRFLPRDRLEPLASYPVRDVGDPPSAPLREGWVFRWKA